MPEALQGDYAIGQIFLPKDPELYEAAKAAIHKTAVNAGHEILGWRKVPTDNSELGPSAVATEPVVEQFFVLRSTLAEDMKLRMEQQVGAP